MAANTIPTPPRRDRPATGRRNLRVARQATPRCGDRSRLLQYYFGTRNDLLLGALEILNSDAEKQARERIEALGPSPGMAAIVRTVLLELLPLDEERRARYLVHVAYFIRFLNDPGLRSAASTTTPSLEELIADLITQAQRTGEADTTVDAAAEADLLVAASQGLQAQLLLDEHTPQRATAIVDQQLSRIFRLQLPSSDGELK